MPRTQSTAGFPVYPKPSTTASRARRSQFKPRICLQHVNAQGACAFLNQLPQEIRFVIYHHVLFVHNREFYFELQAAAEDEAGRLLPSSSGRRFVHRPPSGKRGYVRNDTLALLRTCRSIYAETQTFAVSVNTHVLLYPPSRGLNFPVPTAARTYLKRMPPYLVECVSHVHLMAGANIFGAFYSPTLKLAGFPSASPFAELGLLRNGNGSGCRIRAVPADVAKIHYRPFHPTTLTITVRHDEWQSRPGGFGTNQQQFRLAYMFSDCQTWETVFGSLQRLTMELETDMVHLEELRSEAQKLADIRFNIGEGCKLVCDSSYTIGYWTKTAKAIRRSLDHEIAMQSSSDVYVVFTINWHLIADEIE